MHLDTLYADAALRNVRARHAPAPCPGAGSGADDAAAMLAAARRIVATSRNAFFAAGHPTRAPARAS
jgi:hypothetical protein